VKPLNVKAGAGSMSWEAQAAPPRISNRNRIDTVSALGFTKDRIADEGLNKAIAS
jgi:hypothetical protein